MTDLDIYQPAAVAGYQPGMVMDEKAARALDEQVRQCTKAVLREGTDYGIIPGTNGEKSLWRPGAQKLLQWFGLGYTCERTDLERDDDGRKHGITYKCTVGRRLPDGSLDVKATCEGTADYDESKFWQSAEEVQEKAERNERKWAKKDGRVADPTKWKNRGEYRADWNALMKRAQKRAIVGAVVDATAAGGIFTDREEDDHAPVTEDDGPTWTETAVERANTFTDIDDGRALYVEAAEAHKRGLCNRRQQDLVQNTIKKRVTKLQAVTVVDVEDLGRQAAGAEPDPTRPAAPAATSTGTASSTVPAADDPSDAPGKPEDERPPDRATSGQLSMIGRTLKRLGVDNENRAGVLEKLAGRDLPAGAPLTEAEGRRIRGLLDRCGDRAALVELLATGQLPEAEKAGDDDE